MRELSEQQRVRREKLEVIMENCNPYPEKFEVTNSIKEARDIKDGTDGIKIAGRIIFMRKMGKLSFIRIRDIESSIQVSLKLDLLEDQYQFFKTSFDVGDFIGVEGEIVTTQTGEKTLRAHHIEFLGKALTPLPEKFHSLTDQEIKYRQRYVDLIMNEDARERFLFRSKLIWELRQFLNKKGYIEIETPILNSKPSGALATPFVTHHNALDTDFYLRIAPETYLKRAIVGGFTKVYEFARCFRNEGIDSTHLQDFTMLEGYGAYLNYEDNMIFLKEMLQKTIKKLYGSLKIKISGKETDLSGDWEKISMRDLILKYSEIDIYKEDTKDKLLSKIKENNIEIDSGTPIENLGFGNLVDQLYKKVARPNIINPVFVINHPIELSPLARANDDNPKITDRFQLVINGAEIINAYSELVDPQEQENRLVEQSKLKEAGDEEAMVMDMDYIEAMEYGMPPISGWGIGIDRLVQILTDAPNIKDCVMYPLMKNK